MEATRLREWEKSKQAELEAHRQVCAQNLIVFFGTVTTFERIPLEGDRESDCSES